MSVLVQFKLPCNKTQTVSQKVLWAQIKIVWKMKVQARIITADLCAASLKACDPDDFPNLYILLKIAVTLPVTSCECERSISKTRRLNNYMRLVYHG